MISAACSPRFQPLCQYWPMEPNFFTWSGLRTIRLPSQCCNTDIICLLSMRKRSSDLCKIVLFAHSLATAKWGFHFDPSCLSLPHLLISLHIAMPKVNSFLWTQLLTNVTPFCSFCLSLMPSRALAHRWSTMTEEQEQQSGKHSVQILLILQRHSWVFLATCSSFTCPVWLKVCLSGREPVSALVSWRSTVERRIQFRSFPWLANGVTQRLISSPKISGWPRCWN